uniref:RING-type domain-containing protein n=1 Tax=Amphora coffeiformis TaxID=265554 RepID=A0A7S3PCN5_9STRA|mmetsp:Transcript_14500/g.27621  ORF Transcript_14500/g.27621 Transcript_14500/m.27621 type:complete len:518 (-) Transcript_14500:1611-3164(-)|eukprot:scaffold3849_cov179-Amphora_coffeaeformis.AAC.21
MASNRGSSSFRRRPVSFGNPNLEAYQGTVYTATDGQASVVIEAALPVPEDEHWVALTDVPPEQVPEGVLNLIRAHQPWIRHLRIVVADKNKPDVASIVPKSTSMAESAASLLAASKETTEQERNYIVLMEVMTDEQADQIIEDLDGNPFTSLDETQVGYLEHVIAWEGPESLHAPLFAANHSPRGELVSHNCAVCLESMDDDGEDEEAHTIVTTVCNHTFHLQCLAQCQGSPCPVCRYDHSGLNNESLFSQCHVCGKTEHNFVCLICGTVSCGGGAVARAPPAGDTAVCAAVAAAPPPSPTTVNEAEGPQSHARQHYIDTLHAYALEAETQHVWDFCGQGYVHRLLQNKDDGKLVEIPDPLNTSSQERSLEPGLSSTQEEVVVHRKLEDLASAYYSLLKSQLQAQRVHYEERLTELRREESNRRHRKVRDWVAALKQERHQLSQRLVMLESRRNKAREDAAFLKSMNESLEANKGAWQTRVRQAQEERASVRKVFEDCLPPLQERVTRLMLQLEAER